MTNTFMCAYGSCTVEKPAKEMIALHNFEPYATLRFCSREHLKAYVDKEMSK